MKINNERFDIIGTVYDCAGSNDLIHSETMAKKRKEQNTIPVKKMIELWNIILKLEWMNDHSAGIAVKISGGTVNSWRNGGVENVNADMVRRIEKGLGYKIRLSETGEWQISKIGEDSATQQTRQDSNGRLAEAVDGGEWAAIKSLLETHGITSLSRARRYLQRCEDLEEFFMSIETKARKVELKNNEID